MARHRNSCAKPGGRLFDDAFMDALGLLDFLPGHLAGWRPLIVDGLSFFLDRLPPARLDAIVAEQLALGAAAAPAKRLLALLTQCPTLHKLGQVLARHRRLDPGLQRHLQALETMPAATAIEAVLATIEREIAGLPAVRLGTEALAEGSVAVVLPFTYREAGALRHGVFKALKPGVEERLAEELTVLGELEAFLERRGAELGLPAIDYWDSLRTVGSLLAREVKLEIEQSNLRLAAALYADLPRVLVPRLLPWCNPRLTAMERVFGVKVTDAELSSAQRHQLADTMISALLGQAFWSLLEPAFFHGDLHAGNLLLSEDGRLAILDWSLVARITKAERERLIDIVVAGLTLDAAKLRAALAALSALPVDEPVLAKAAERALDRLVQQQCLPGFDWLIGLLDELALGIATGFGQDFALLRKTWLSLSGVIRDLCEDSSPDSRLLQVALRRFAAELPCRWLALPDARGFATHVSNAELVRIVASSAIVAARYWSRYWNQGLRVMSSVA